MRCCGCRHHVFMVNGLVPAAAAVAALSTADSAFTRLLATCAVQVGSRVEVDTSRCPPTVGRRVWQYWQRARLSVHPDSRDPVRVHTQVFTARAASPEDRSMDLMRTVVDELSGWNGIGPVVAAVTGGDRDTAHAVAAACGWSVEPDNNHTRYRLSAPTAGCPALFGGPAMLRETARWVELVVNYAQWRDRRARRLVSVCVTSESAWPSP